MKGFRDGVRWGFNVSVWVLTAWVLVTGWQWPRPVTLAVPMAGYGLPVCASEDSAPAGGCVWEPGDGPVWINHPGRT